MEVAEVTVVLDLVVHRVFVRDEVAPRLGGVVAQVTREPEALGRIQLLFNKINRQIFAGMRIRIRIRSDSVIFGPPDPDPVLFSTDPDPTCNKGFIKLFLS